MKWEDIYNEEWKIRHVMEDVMGWECFGSWEEYLKKYGAQEHELGAGKSYTTPTPVAYYAYNEWRVFSADHDADREELKVFDPLHNWNDAWLVVREMNTPVQGSTRRYTTFIVKLENITDASLVVDLFSCDPESDDQHLTPEHICQAAYEAVQANVSPS